MKKIGVGIIGLGYVGNIHLRHLVRLQNVDYVAAADISKKALDYAKSCGADKTFSNYQDLLKEPNIDAVIIALPTHLHLQCVIQASEAKKHIFLEKPIWRIIDHT